MTYDTLDIRRDGAVAWLTLNRSHVLNALSYQMVEDLSNYFDMLRADKQTRVVVIRGAGRAFCAGLDLKENRPREASGGEHGDGLLSSTAATLAFQRRISGLVVKIHHLPQPFIAAVHGPAAGGGFSLTLACEVRIAAESARFNAAFVRVGLSGCDMGASYFLPRAVGTSVAFELLTTGRFVDAKRALAIGLVSEVVPESELETAAGKLAREMAELSPLGLTMTKEGVWANLDAGSLEAALELENRTQTLCVQAGYLAEGARAFNEKRKPRFDQVG
ncbi:MAG: enoyl-CoA hydratase/isomerase family protein [Candidatus Binataceae bacterium]